MYLELELKPAQAENQNQEKKVSEFHRIPEKQSDCRKVLPQMEKNPVTVQKQLVK